MSSCDDVPAKFDSSTDVELSEEAKATYLAAEKFHYIEMKEDESSADQNNLEDQLFNQQYEEKPFGKGLN